MPITTYSHVSNASVVDVAATPQARALLRRLLGFFKR